MKPACQSTRNFKRIETDLCSWRIRNEIRTCGKDLSPDGATQLINIVMKKIITSSVIIVFSLLVLASCNSKTSNTPDITASSETVQVSKEEKESIESKTESIPVGSEVSLESGFSSELEVSSGSEASSESAVSSEPASGREEKVHNFIISEGTTLESRFAVPEGYIRTEYPEGSFGSFVRSYPMKPDGSPVLLWTKEPKGNQRDHVAVFDMMVEDELDVQQCADSVMRIYAEYFRATGQYDRIRFHFVSGFLCDYNSYIQGNRVQVSGDDVVWVQSQPAEDSDSVFNEYMKIVCAYASTLSMESESVSADLQDLQIGDIFLKGGSPGHVVMVADVCERDGRKAFLLAQGYMPAQEFHIVKNPLHENDPWYYEEEVQYPFRTQAYTFPEGSFRRLQY